MTQGLDYSTIQAQAESIADHMMAERAKVDLYYLCAYILGGENIMDVRVHGPLCRAMRPLLFYKDPDTIAGIEFPSDYGYTDSHGLPTEEEKQTFFEWQKKFMPDADTGVAEDKFQAALNKLLALMPRGTLKSTIITIGFAIQWHLNFPDDRILLDSETWTKTKAFLTEIKGHYAKNKKLRRIYGALYKNSDGSPMTPDQNEKHDTWSTEAINLSCRSMPRKEPSIDCAGVEVTKTGMHYDLILGDDLQSEKNSKELEQIEKVKEHYKLLYSLLEPGASLAIIGTRWDDDDLYQMIIDEQADEFNFITRMAEADDGSLFYPSRLTRKILDNFRKILGSYLYSCQYLNNPIDIETADFKPSYFKHLSIEEYREIRKNEYGLVDPSYRGVKGQSDYAAFVIGAMGTRGEIYARFAFKDKMIYSQIIDKMFELDLIFGPRLWVVEVIGTKSLEHDIERAQNKAALEGRRRLNIKFVYGHLKDKESRIRALTAHYERGDAYHIVGGGMIDSLEAELKRFPKAKNDDLSDCWSGILNVGHAPREDPDDESGSQKRKKYIRMLNKPKSPMMGY